MSWRELEIDGKLNQMRPLDTWIEDPWVEEPRAKNCHLTPLPAVALG